MKSLGLVLLSFFLSGSIAHSQSSDATFEVTPEVLKQIKELTQKVKTPVVPPCKDTKCSPDYEEQWLRAYYEELMLRKMAESIRLEKLKDCSSAICIDERFEFYSVLKPGLELNARKCEAAICTDIEQPFIPDWLKFNIELAKEGDPFNGCKDAVCIAPTGKPIPGDDDADKEAARVEEAAQTIKDELAERKQAAMEAQAAEANKTKAQADADEAQKDADEAAAASKEALASALRTEQLKLAARAEAAASESSKPDEKPGIWSVAEANWARVDELSEKADAAASAADEASVRLAVAEAKADAAERALVRTENRVRMAWARYTAEIGQNPYLSNSMATCRYSNCVHELPASVIGTIFGNSPKVD